MLIKTSTAPQQEAQLENGSFKKFGGKPPTFNFQANKYAKEILLGNKEQRFTSTTPNVPIASLLV